MAVTTPVVNLINPAFINQRTAHLVSMTADIIQKVNLAEFDGSATTYGGAIAAINAATAGLTGTDALTTSYKTFLNNLKTKLS